MQLELDEFEHIRTYTTDSRGRITLGSEYAGEDVKVVVVRLEE